MVTIVKDLVSPSKYAIKAPAAMDAEYVTIHNTANDATAQGEINYMTGNGSPTGYHFAVDDLKVIQGIPTNRMAYACGDGRYGTGNTKSISIEICYSKSGGAKYYKAVALAEKLTAQLLFERKWGTNRVKPHQFWSGKYCPHRIFDDKGWDKFIANVQKELSALQGGKTVSVVSNPVVTAPRGYSLRGDSGAATKKIQDLLIKAGYSVGKAGADGEFGKGTEDAVRKLQEDYKLTVDGVVGNGTMQVLEALTTKERDYLINGDYGSAVKEIQTQLTTLGYKVGAIDSRFGGATEDAVRDYQEDKKLAVDGVAGAATRKHLKADVAAKKRNDAKKAADAKAKKEAEAKAKAEAEKAQSAVSQDTIGLLVVVADNLNVRQKADFNSKVVKVLKKGGTYKVYSQKNGLYKVGLDQYVSAGKEYVRFAKHKQVKILADSLFTYNTANWNDKGVAVKKNQVFTIIKELTVDGAKMYQIKSGLYVSANVKYVEVL